MLLPVIKTLLPVIDVVNWLISVPMILDDGMPVSLAPEPENAPIKLLAVISDAVTDPVNMGLSERTLLDVAVPVDVVVPVPPLATASVPVETLVALKLVMVDPGPLKAVVAVMLATLIMDGRKALPIVPDAILVALKLVIDGPWPLKEDAVIVDVDAIVEVVLMGPVRPPPVKLSFESVNSLIFDAVAAKMVDVLMVESDSWVTPITVVVAEAMDVMGIFVREAPDPLKRVARITLPAVSVPLIITLLRVALVN